MNKPVINIITRFSRKDKIQKVLDSVQSQTYDNIHHIITYENSEDKEFLESKTTATLVKVPKWSPIPDLCMSCNIHDDVLRYPNPDPVLLDMKVHTELVDSGEYKELPVKDKKYTYWENGVQYYRFTAPRTLRRVLKHFSPNLYLKLAECYTKEGWVLYLDDDDVFIEDKVLEQIVPFLVSRNSLYIVKRLERNKKTYPQKAWWNIMDKANYPLALEEVGGSNIIYHTKWKEYTDWGEWRGGDYRTYKSLEGVIPNKTFIDKVMVHIGGTK